MTTEPTNGWMTHKDFHPFAAEIGRLGQKASDTTEHMRDLRRAIEDVSVKQAAAHKELKGELFAALAEYERRHFEMLNTIRVENSARARTQNVWNIVGIGASIAAVLLAALTVKPSHEDLSRALSAGAQVAGAVAERM